MYETLIKAGRVIDPETGHDAVADIAIAEGRIVAIGALSGDAATIIDAAGLVVAPGFIDLHAHGQSLPADRMQAFDGVTTSLELELGAPAGGALVRGTGPCRPRAELRRLHRLGVCPRRRHDLAAD